MIAAIYARKSTDQSTVADEAKSVTRQIAHARDYATRKGWTVDEACVFVDDGISGAEFANRPGFVRLMASLTPRPPFQFLIVSEESRIGREQLEVGYALKQLLQAGVRVFCYLENRERTLDSPIEKAMLTLQTMADEMEREKARLRMVDTMTRKAKSGHVTGGQCFGYDNIPVLGANGERSHVEQRINTAEADVIRRIFELAAAGYGQVRIAKQLNAENLPAPRSQRGRPRAWVSSSVHEALFRPRYRGELVWNRTKKRDRWGRCRPTGRDSSEWVRMPAPQLRIVPEELWQAAHAKIDAARAVTNLKRRTPRESRYLLPGIARCAWCGGGLHVRLRTRSSGRVDAFYACTSHFNRGETVCRNVVQVPMTEVDAAVLAEIRDIVTPDVADGIVGRVRDMLDPGSRAAEGARGTLMEQLASIEQQAANLAEAIAMGGDVPALVTRLQSVDRRRQELTARLDGLEYDPATVRVDWRAVERRARHLAAKWRALLGRHITEARGVLQEMLDGPLLFTPILEEARRGVRVDGAITISEILAGNCDVTRLASPVGILGSLPGIPFSRELLIVPRAA